MSILKATTDKNFMNQIGSSPPPSSDPLGDYVAGVNKLPGKLARIAANQRSSELSLKRAAAALRSIAALNTRNPFSDFRNTHPNIENVAGASR